MKPGQLFPVADYPTYAERDALGNVVAPVTTFCGKYTGEKRPPLRGEWFLSGASVAAYRAPNDLSTPYHIAKLVRVEIRRTSGLNRTVSETVIIAE